jgi:1,4-alpha-glucan branching enzyme
MPDSAPRVLILTADFPPRHWSGIGVAVEHQASALSDLGIGVQVLVAARPGWPAPTLTSGRLDVGPLSTHRFPVNPHDFKLIHVHSLGLADLAIELRRRTALPLVYTAHTLVAEELAGEMEATFWRAAQERLFRSSDHVVFVSAAERTSALRMMPELVDRSTVVPNGVPAPPTLSAASVAEGPIVFAGRFARSKGLELLSELIPMVLARRRAQFILAGGHGDVVGGAIARRLGTLYRDACTITGWLDRQRMDALLARAALVLVPSVYEPFGLVAVEAMRVGAPVIASAVGGLPEVVGGGLAGCLVGSRDPRKWLAAVVGILNDPDRVRDLRRRGPIHVLTHFEARRNADLLIGRVYARLGVVDAARQFRHATPVGAQS